MTLDHAVALSLVENLPRVNLTDRLKQRPESARAARRPLLEQARDDSRAAPSEQASTSWRGTTRVPGRCLPRSPTVRRCCGIAGHSSATEPPAVAIVGSRAASAVALETARRLAADLGRARHHGRQRSRARRRLGGASRRASSRVARSPSSGRASTASIRPSTRRSRRRSRAMAWSSASFRPATPPLRFTFRCAIV